MPGSRGKVSYLLARLDIIAKNSSVRETMNGWIWSGYDPDSDSLGEG
jgi:hypothetical protein